MMICTPGILPNRIDTLDPDVRAFLNASGISDPIIRNALNNFVLFLKANSLWTRFHAIYPFVGGTAFTHKFNLRNPADLDSAFRLLFFGGWVHNANGITPNGINTYADTFYRESVNSHSINNKHISVYCRVNQQTLKVDMGATGSTTIASNTTDIVARANLSGDKCIMRNSSLSGTTTSSFANADSRGWFFNNRVSGTEIRAFKNSTLNVISSNSTTLLNYKYYIGASNVADTSIGFVSTRNLSFASIGEGYNDAEAALIYSAVQTLQTELNRQV